MLSDIRGLMQKRDDVFFPLQTQFDRFFNDFFHDNKILNVVKSTSGYPKMDIIEEKDKFIVRIAIPGVNPKNIKVEMLNDAVKIYGKMEEEYKSSEDAIYYVRELHKSQFSRSVALPDYIKGEPIADCKNGILTLTWTCCVDEEEKPKLIKIN